MGKKLRSVEGARGVAALSVLTYHVTTYTPGIGPLERATSSYLWLGVPLFFLLSGLLLFRPFARAIIHREPWPSLSRYARSRFLRIFPAYWLVLTFAIIETSSLVRPPRGVLDLHLLPAAAAAGAVFLWCRAYYRRTTQVLPLAVSIGAAALLALHPGAIWPGVANYALVYLPFRLTGEIGVAWTLCIEVSFYATLPLFAIAARRIARRIDRPNRRALLVAALLLPAFPISYLYLGHAGFDSSQLPIWLPGYLDEFAIGMLLAVALEVRSHIAAGTSRVMLLAAAAAAFGATKLHSVGAPGPYGHGSSVLYAPAMEVAFALALASVLMRDERTLLGHALASRPVVALGTISYGIYLWHVLVIERLMPTPLWANEWVGLLLTVPVTVALAAGSWFAIERPALAFKNRRISVAWHEEPLPAAVLQGSA